jgi:hypothetical protein
MLSLTQMQKRLANKNCLDADFLEMHICVEGLLKRALFIGLRLHKVQYRDAQQFIKVYNPNGVKTLIKQALKLLDIPVAASPKFEALEELVVEFTAKWRNLRLHDIHDEITDKPLLKLLIGIDRAFMLELCRLIKQEKKAGVFDKPALFKAVRVKNQRDPKEILASVLGEGSLGHPVKYTQEKAEKMFAALKNKE